MPTWPAGLPQYVSPEQYRELPPRAAAEVPMDAGMPKSFRTSLDDGRRFSVSLPADGAELEIFDAFWRGDLRDGEQTFDWVLPRTQTATKFAITDRPVYRHLGGDNYEIRFRLETRDPDTSTGFRSRSTTRAAFTVAQGYVTSFRSVSGSHGDFSNT